MPLDLDKLEALARAATPGPWTYDGDIRASDGSFIIRDDRYSPTTPGDSDAAFIAAANPATALALIDEIREWRSGQRP